VLTNRCSHPFSIANSNSAAGPLSPNTTQEDLDPRAPVVGRETFTLMAELAIRQAVRLQYYVSLVAIEADIEGFGATPDLGTLYRLLAEVIRGHVRGTDLITVTPPHVHVLLVSAHLHDLPTVIERIATAVSRHTFDANGRRGRVTLSIGGASFPTTARARPELFRQVESLSAAARSEAGAPGHRYRLAARSS
jgi:GGDEF domain-containing protein